MIDPLEFFNFFIEHLDTVWEQTLEHILLTSISIVLSTLTGISAGILLTKFPKLSSPVLGFTNIIQTIPSLALLGLLLPFLGIGVFPAIVALFLYALLPIVRNTYAGITEIDKNLIEVAEGMGLTQGQILIKIQIPIALPMIFAGIRTAAVINIGIATLTALIGAGGLGEYIFRGISVNNSYMILSGALPAAILALLADYLLGLLQKNIRKLKYIYLFMAAGIVFIIAYGIISEEKGDKNLVAGFPSEFMEREDGYKGLIDTYELDFEVKEMEIGLMYNAIKNREVDVISGFSTDGRIRAYDLRILIDNKNYFPPYHAIPMVRKEVLEQNPELKNVFNKMFNLISDSSMMNMNFRVDQDKIDIKEVAEDFLKGKGFRTEVNRSDSPDLLIGSKAFTESFILAEIIRILIENYTTLNAETKLGFGGTKLIFDAIKNDQIDIYPEYTGTALLVLLNSPDEVRRNLGNDKEKVLDYVKEKLSADYQLILTDPFGFNNTFALMVRERMAKRHKLEKISDLTEID